MNIQRILKYLEHIAKNNNRDWYQAHKDEYLACRNDFEEGVDRAIAAISKFIKDILVHTSVPKVVSRCMLVITSMCSQAIVCCRPELIGCPPIS